jgi:hypothetical protein
MSRTLPIASLKSAAALPMDQAMTVVQRATPTEPTELAGASGVTDAAPADPPASPRVLVVASTLYLCLPLAMWAATWVRPELGVPVAAAVLAATLASNRGFNVGGHLGSHRQVLALAALAVALAWFTGAGGFAHQTTDWFKHNAILHDLTEQPWPVAYRGEPDLGLSYYVAYYLPAAAVGKAFGWWAANVALLAWTAVGTFLALAWVRELVGGTKRYAMIAFFGWCGLDIVGILVYPLVIGGSFVDWQVQGLNFWNGNFAADNNLTHLSWATNHAVGGWIFLALVLRAGWEHRNLAAVVLWGTAGFLWAPFVVIGALPFLAVMLCRGRTWATLAGPVNATGVVIAALVLTYFASKAGGDAGHLGGSGMDIGFVLTSPRAALGARAIVIGLALFLILEWYVPFGLLARTRLLVADERLLLGIGAATFLACVPVRVGANHDLLIRGTMPALFVVAVLAARVLQRAPRPSRLRTTVLVVVALGLLTAAGEVRRSLEPSWSLAKYSVTDPDAVPSIPQIFGGSSIYSQYVSSTDTFFWQHLAADLEPRLCVNLDGNARPAYSDLQSLEEPLVCPAG